MNSSGLKGSVVVTDTSKGGMCVCVNVGHGVRVVKGKWVGRPNCAHGQVIRN